MQRHLCIHGHFYQPPREDPWLGSILPEGSAAPFHDWNVRIARESYAPLAWARRLDAQGRIADIMNCYAWMSFNIGPTLLRWLAHHAHLTLKRMIEGDAISKARWGHGNAIAQVYHHTIMPLATEQDKMLEITWAIDDFEAHFGRRPQGMWLAETAVDTATLEALAQEDITFTILAPRQAKAIAPYTQTNAPIVWQPVTADELPPEPYCVELPSGRTITIFFYNAQLSQAVAFEKLLRNGDIFWNRIQETAQKGLLTICTDGETYGHHFHFGEMALAYVLGQASTGKEGILLTNFATYLQRNPPQYRVQLHEPSSWSCVHGIERWKSDCGCTDGGHPEWNQRWRAPLRSALELVRKHVDQHYHSAGKKVFTNPTLALREFGKIIAEHAKAPLPCPVESEPAQRCSIHHKTSLLSTIEKANVAYEPDGNTSCPSRKALQQARIDFMQRHRKRKTIHEEKEISEHVHPIHDASSNKTDTQTVTSVQASTNRINHQKTTTTRTLQNNDTNDVTPGLNSQTHEAHYSAQDDTAWKLLAMQEASLASFASCAWFFDDLARIEPINAMTFALRAIDLATDTGLSDNIPHFRAALAQAWSNQKDEGDGSAIFDRYVLERRETPATLIFQALCQLEAAGIAPQQQGQAAWAWPMVHVRVTRSSEEALLFKEKIETEQTPAHPTQQNVEFDSLSNKTVTLHGSVTLRQALEHRGRNYTWFWHTDIPKRSSVPQPVTMSEGCSPDVLSLQHTDELSGYSSMGAFASGTLQLIHPDGNSEFCTVNNLAYNRRTALLNAIAAGTNKKAEQLFASLGEAAMRLILPWHEKQQTLHHPSIWTMALPTLGFLLIDSEDSMTSTSFTTLAPLIQNTLSPLEKNRLEEQVEAMLLRMLEHEKPNWEQFEKKMAKVLVLIPSMDWWNIQNGIWQHGFTEPKARHCAWQMGFSTSDESS